MAQILLVDDEDSYLEILTDVLSIAGHECARAHDGREALASASATRPDLVVTDHMMPHMTGVELLRSLRDTPSLASVPTILLSAIRPTGYELATRFLQKPIHVDTIHRAVGELVEPRSSRTTDAAKPSLTQTREEALSWVAHEIKNPLATAMMNVEMMIAHGPDDVQLRHLTTMRRQLERMDELVVSVLDAAALGDGRVVLHKAPVDIGELVTRLAEDWRATFSGHTITVDVRQQAVCNIDRERFRQIVDNLVANAVKYGGSAPVDVRVDADADVAWVAVHDRGMGIHAHELERIFDRFHRAKHGGRGHGLGLYIAAALARLHDGALQVDSKVGEGSTFTLTLPRVGGIRTS